MTIMRIKFERKRSTIKHNLSPVAVVAAAAAAYDDLLAAAVAVVTTLSAAVVVAFELQALDAVPDLAPWNLGLQLLERLKRGCAQIMEQEKMIKKSHLFHTMMRLTGDRPV